MNRWSSIHRLSALRSLSHSITTPTVHSLRIPPSLTAVHTYTHTPTWNPEPHRLDSLHICLYVPLPAFCAHITAWRSLLGLLQKSSMLLTPSQSRGAASMPVPARCLCNSALKGAGKEPYVMHPLRNTKRTLLKDAGCSAGKWCVSKWLRE